MRMEIVAASCSFWRTRSVGQHSIVGAELVAQNAASSAIASARSILETMSQPSTGSTPGMPVSAIVLRTYSTPSRDSAHSALA